MICKTIEQFKRVIYNYMPESLDESVWESLQIYLGTANRWIKNNFLGNELYNKYEETPQEVKELLDAVVAFKAYYEAIPSLDLVLTSTGFGIVSTTSIAPASRDRVLRLRSQVQDSMFNSLDELLNFFLNVEELRVLFEKGKPFKKLTDSLFITATDLELYAGIEGATRKTLYENKAQIAEGELQVQKRISVVYFNELIDKVRQNNLTREDENILYQAKQLVGFYLTGQSAAFKTLAEHMVNTMEAQANSYPTYLGSIEYKNKNAPGYENKKEDSTFFFG